jgi:hypothetical protein
MNRKQCFKILQCEPKFMIRDVASQDKLKVWSADNCEQFLRLHEAHNNHWLQISQILKNKSEHDVKNHFYSLLRKYISKITNHDFNFEGHLDLIQCYYIVHHIVSFFTHKRNNLKKEYLSTLISLKKITELQSLQYFQSLCHVYPILKKLGWKAYLKELKRTSEISLKGFVFPNRILPCLNPCIESSFLTREEKNRFMDMWIMEIIN